MPETAMPPGAAFVIALVLLSAAGFVLMIIYKVLVWRDTRAREAMYADEDTRPTRRRRYHAAAPARRARPPLPIHWFMSRSDRFVVLARAANPNASVRAEIPLLNGVEPQSEPFVNRPELRLNADELAAVARMIDHNRTAAKPSKSSTIQAGFGVSRGGSESYKRASVIYDALFGPPAPAVTFRELTPEQERLRSQLLKQKGALN